MDSTKKTIWNHPARTISRRSGGDLVSSTAVFQENSIAPTIAAKLPSAAKEKALFAAAPPLATPTPTDAALAEVTAIGSAATTATVKAVPGAVFSSAPSTKASTSS